MEQCLQNLCSQHSLMSYGNLSRRVVIICTSYLHYKFSRPGTNACNVVKQKMDWARKAQVSFNGRGPSAEGNSVIPENAGTG